MGSASFRAAAWAAPLLLSVACGSTSVPQAPTDASADAADASVPYLGDASSPDVSTPDAGPPIALVDGGGVFTCYGCPCDGRTHYCDIGSAGPPPPEPADAGCSNAKRCVPYPVTCGSAPDCSCFTKCSAPELHCYRAPSGDGLMAGCVYL